MKILFLPDPAGVAEELSISDAALKLVRASFNPSGKPEVDAAKLLAAALVDKTMGADPVDGRAMAIARQHFETGAMFLVKALTA